MALPKGERKSFPAANPAQVRQALARQYHQVPTDAARDAASEETATKESTWE